MNPSSIPSLVKADSVSNDEDNTSNDKEISHAVTRANKAALQPLVLKSIEPLNIHKNDFVELQTNCETLSNVRDLVLSGDPIKSRTCREY